MLNHPNFRTITLQHYAVSLHISRAGYGSDGIIRPLMKVLNITWQRLLIAESGQTCPRCGSTEEELEKAVYTLKQSLAPLGIEVNLEKKVLDPEPFARDALESNRIWISERPLEEWLGAEVGHSFCCEVCGNAECRTVEVGEETYETIPASLIIQAGLVAASKMVDTEAKEKMPPRICCPGPHVDSNECK